MGLALRPTLRGARGWPRNWITQFVMLANFQRSFGANADIWALRIGFRTAAGATLRGARGWPRNWITLFILRIFCALDGWEDVGDPELLDDTSEQFRRQKHFDLETP